jgi:hypothetical protein
VFILKRSLKVSRVGGYFANADLLSTRWEDELGGYFFTLVRGGFVARFSRVK